MNGVMTVLSYLSRILIAVIIGIGALIVFMLTIAIANTAPMAGPRTNRGPYHW